MRVFLRLSSATPRTPRIGPFIPSPRPRPYTSLTMMKAAFLTAIRKMEVRDTPRPQSPAKHEVLLRVDSVGICGSDMHYYRAGRIGGQVIQYPWIVGHEFGATVAAVGKSVKTLKVGQKVAIDPLIACGRCDQCRSGRAHTCRSQRFMGCPGQLPGCMAEFVLLPEACCVPLPRGLSAIEAAMSEPFSIALHARALGQLDEAPAKTRIAILGCGPIGLCVLAALKSSKTASPLRIYATDLLDNRLAIARKMGARWTANATKQNVVADILNREKLGMDLVFECAGQQETIDQALHLLAPGGRLVLVGIPESDRISLEMDAFRRKELNVQCVRRQNACVAPALKMLAGRKVDLTPMITHHFALDQSPQAFEMVADYRDGVVKAIVHLSDQELLTK